MAITTVGERYALPVPGPDCDMDMPPLLVRPRSGHESAPTPIRSGCLLLLHVAQYQFDRLRSCFQGDDGFGHMAGMPGPLPLVWRNTGPPRAVVPRDRTYDNSLYSVSKKTSTTRYPAYLNMVCLKYLISFKHRIVSFHRVVHCSTIGIVPEWTVNISSEPEPMPAQKNEH